mmetsp:Transcript_13088/g.20982  ORF Transcript_13088/g.20982 Transcript_13088/m.20982 type:complete len:145 (-) Transcript_13088:826-1260(-)
MPKKRRKTTTKGNKGRGGKSGASSKEESSSSSPDCNNSRKKKGKEGDKKSSIQSLETSLIHILSGKQSHKNVLSKSPSFDGGYSRRFLFRSLYKSDIFEIPTLLSSVCRNVSEFFLFLDVLQGLLCSSIFLVGVRTLYDCHRFL